MKHSRDFIRAIESLTVLKGPAMASATITYKVSEYDYTPGWTQTLIRLHREYERSLNMTRAEMRKTCPLRNPSFMRRAELTVALDASQASAPVYASFDGGRTWDRTMFQTASFGHRLTLQALRHIRRWYLNQGA